MGKGQSLPQMVGKSRSTCKILELGTYPTPYTKWSTDLNIRSKTIKLLGENMKGQLHDIGFGIDLLIRYQRHRGKNTNIDKWTTSKSKTAAKHTSKKAIYGMEKVTLVIYLIRGLYKEVQLNKPN